MAALIPKGATRVPKRYNVCAASYMLQKRDYLQQPRIIKNPTTAKLRKGTGSRNSFNGIVCTVFGNTGYLAKYICTRLGNIGTQLILPYRGEHYYSMRLKLCGDLGQIIFHPFYLKDEESIAKCVKYSNVVINLIGQNYETSTFSFKDVHIDGMRRLARICKEHNVERLIHITNLAAGPEPPTLIKPKSADFYESKWKGECAMREEFPDLTVVRLSDVIGIGDRFVSNQVWKSRLFKEVWPLFKKGEESIKQPVLAEDVGSGITAIATDPSTKGKTYQFVGPKRYKLSGLILWISVLTRQVRVPPEIIDMQLYRYRLLLNFLGSSAVRRILTYDTLSWENIEKDHVTDTVMPGIPTLEDLGIIPSSIEDMVPYIVRTQVNVGAPIEYRRLFEPIPPPEEVPFVTPRL